MVGTHLSIPTLESRLKNSRLRADDFKKACELAGIYGFRFHDLRHTFGTRLAEAGESLHRIAELMGHSNIQMTMQYAHAVASGKHEAVERLVNYKEKVCPK